MFVLIFQVMRGKHYNIYRNKLVKSVCYRKGCEERQDTPN